MSCEKCAKFDYIEDSDSDGFVRDAGFVCGYKQGYTNLKSFPFKKTMSCFEGQERNKKSE